MATKLLRVPIDQGSDEYVEVEVDTRDLGESVRLTSESRPDAVTAPFSLASSVDRILPALSAILTRLRRADHAPDEIGMELGLKIGGETGLIFAKGTAESTFTITLSWAQAERPHRCPLSQWRLNALSPGSDTPMAGWSDWPSRYFHAIW